MWAYIKAAIMAIPIIDKWAERIFKQISKWKRDGKKEEINEANTPGDFTDIVS